MQTTVDHSSLATRYIRAAGDGDDGTPAELVSPDVLAQRAAG
jgi:hypothetical protein